MQYRFISADNHLDLAWVPRNVFQDRLPERLRRDGPRVEETPDGSFWFWEGRRRGASADGSSNAKHLQPFRDKGANVADGALPPSDPGYMLEHMDMAGIWASVTFGDVRRWNIADPELLLATYQAYNDHVLAMQDVDPDRLVMLPAVPTARPEVCVAELQRVAARGARGIEFNPFDVAEPAYSEVWEPFWAAAEEAGIVVCIHIGGKADSVIPGYGRGAHLAFMSTAPFNLANTCAQMVFSAVFERHPKLQVLFAECRIGWVPFFIQWMDRQTVERRPDTAVPISLLPSEYVERQITFAFEEDYIGGHLLEYEWSKLQGCAIWGSDYPHLQGTWPDVAGPLDQMFARVDPAVKQRVLYGRAAELFRIQGPHAAA